MKERHRERQQPTSAISAASGPEQLVIVLQSALRDTQSRLHAAWQHLATHMPPLVSLQGLATLPFSLGWPHKSGAATRISRIRDSAAAAAFGLHPASLLAEGIKHERAFDMTAAARCYELAIAACDKHWLSSADGVEAMVRLAKQSSDQGWQTYAALHRLPHVRNSTPPPSTNLAHGLACIQEGVALAEEVLVMAPHRARAHTGAALGLGRLALFVSDTRQRVALCNRIRREAETAVKLDPGDDAAHHVLGRWHMEVASLNPVVRLVMRHVYGGDIKASTTQALHHFNQARQIAPQRLAHAAELGKALMKLGRRKEAYETLKQALQCDIEDVNAAMGKMHVERMLKKLKKQDRQAVREERRNKARQRRAEAAQLKAESKT